MRKTVLAVPFVVIACSSSTAPEEQGDCSNPGYATRHTGRCNPPCFPRPSCDAGVDASDAEVGTDATSDGSEAGEVATDGSSDVDDAEDAGTD